MERPTREQGTPGVVGTWQGRSWVTASVARATGSGSWGLSVLQATTRATRPRLVGPMIGPNRTNVLISLFLFSARGRGEPSRPRRTARRRQSAAHRRSLVAGRAPSMLGARLTLTNRSTRPRRCKNRHRHASLTKAVRAGAPQRPTTVRSSQALLHGSAPALPAEPGEEWLPAAPPPPPSPSMGRS